MTLRALLLATTLALLPTPGSAASDPGAAEEVIRVAAEGVFSAINENRAAYEEAIAETSTDQAPWYVVPADRKWYRNWVVLNVLLATLEQMDPQFPPEEPGLDDLVIR